MRYTTYNPEDDYYQTHHTRELCDQDDTSDPTCPKCGEIMLADWPDEPGYLLAHCERCHYAYTQYWDEEPSIVCEGDVAKQHKQGHIK